MFTEFVLFVMFVGTLFVSFLLYLKVIDERNYNLYLQGKLNPYKRKKYFMTLPEKELFSLLQKMSSEKGLLIFPQLHLSTLLVVNDGSNDLQGKFDWLNRLFVDFVLFDRQTLEPVLVVELNDSTHFWNNRKARDQFVQKALEENGIPFIAISTDKLPDTREVTIAIESELQKHA